MLNERFGTGFTAADELWEQIRAGLPRYEAVRNAGAANPLDNFAYVFDPKLEEIVMNRMDRNSDQAVKFMEQPEIRSFITRLIASTPASKIEQRRKSDILRSQLGISIDFSHLALFHVNRSMREVYTIAGDSNEPATTLALRFIYMLT